MVNTTIELDIFSINILTNILTWSVEIIFITIAVLVIAKTKYRNIRESITEDYFDRIYYFNKQTNSRTGLILLAFILVTQVLLTFTGALVQSLVPTETRYDNSNLKMVTGIQSRTQGVIPISKSDDLSYLSSLVSDNGVLVRQKTSPFLMSAGEIVDTNTTAYTTQFYSKRYVRGLHDTTLSFSNRGYLDPDIGLTYGITSMSVKIDGVDASYESLISRRLKEVTDSVNFLGGSRTTRLKLFSRVGYNPVNIDIVKRSMTSNFFQLDSDFASEQLVVNKTNLLASLQENGSGFILSVVSRHGNSGIYSQETYKISISKVVQQDGTDFEADPIYGNVGLYRQDVSCRDMNGSHKVDDLAGVISLDDLENYANDVNRSTISEHVFNADDAVYSLLPVYVNCNNKTGAYTTIPTTTTVFIMPASAFAVTILVPILFILGRLAAETSGKYRHVLWPLHARLMTSVVNGTCNMSRRVVSAVDTAMTRDKTHVGLFILNRGVTLGNTYQLTEAIPCLEQSRGLNTPICGGISEETYQAFIDHKDDYREDSTHSGGTVQNIVGSPDVELASLYNDAVSKLVVKLFGKAHYQHTDKFNLWLEDNYKLGIKTKISNAVTDIILKCEVCRSALTEDQLKVFVRASTLRTNGTHKVTVAEKPNIIKENIARSSDGIDEIVTSDTFYSQLYQSQAIIPTGEPADSPEMYLHDISTDKGLLHQDNGKIPSKACSGRSTSVSDGGHSLEPQHMVVPLAVDSSKLKITRCQTGPGTIYGKRSRTCDGSRPTDQGLQPKKHCSGVIASGDVHSSPISYTRNTKLRGVHKINIKGKKVWSATAGVRAGFILDYRASESNKGLRELMCVSNEDLATSKEEPPDLCGVQEVCNIVACSVVARAFIYNNKIAAGLKQNMTQPYLGGHVRLYDEYTLFIAVLNNHIYTKQYRYFMIWLSVPILIKNSAPVLKRRIRLKVMFQNMVWLCLCLNGSDEPLFNYE